MNAEMILRAYLISQIWSNSCVHETTSFFFQHILLCLCVIMCIHVFMRTVHLSSPCGHISLCFPQATSLLMCELQRSQKTSAFFFFFFFPNVLVCHRHYLNSNTSMEITHSLIKSPQSSLTAII